MLTARNLSKRFDAKRVFDKVDITLEPGTFLLVTGPNGSGKTTLLRVLAGLAAPTGGELELPLLERFGLWDVRNQRVGTFSRGMQQRLGLCRVVLHDPQLLVLDEPFNALDAAGAELLDATLAELASRAVVVATHDPGRVERLAT